MLLATKKDPMRDKLQVHVVGESGKHESFGINSNHFFTGRLAGRLKTSNLCICMYLLFVVAICML